MAIDIQKVKFNGIILWNCSGKMQKYPQSPEQSSGEDCNSLRHLAHPCGSAGCAEWFRRIFTIGLGQFKFLSAIAIIATLLYSIACACAPSGRGLGMSF